MNLLRFINIGKTFFYKIDFFGFPFICLVLFSMFVVFDRKKTKKHSPSDDFVENIESNEIIFLIENQDVVWTHHILTS